MFKQSGYHPKIAKKILPFAHDLLAKVEGVFKVYNADNKSSENILKMELIAHMKKQPLDVFYQKDVLIKFTKYTGKNLCWSLSLLKLQSPGDYLFCRACKF